MLLNHSLHLAKDEERIAALVGPSYSLFTKISMGGTGSEKMEILACSSYFKEVLHQFQETNFGSLEIRTKGILVHFNNGRNYHVWCIPYYRLSIYKTDTLSIHGEGHMVRFKTNQNKNNQFIRKLLDELANFQKNYQLPND